LFSFEVFCEVGDEWFFFFGVDRYDVVVFELEGDLEVIVYFTTLFFYLRSVFSAVLTLLTLQYDKQ
jgi:hypothetical protein